MWTFIVVLVLLTAGHRVQGYDNALKGTLIHVCPTNQVVSRIQSVNSYFDSDRQWNIECKAFGSTRQGCSWSGPYNLYEQELSFNCPANRVIAGVYSLYNSVRRDRSWYFYCCSAPIFVTFECRETPMVNYWNEDFDWYVPGDNFLTGVQTQNKNNGDHRWSFNYCRGTTQDTKIVSSQIFDANQQIGSYLIEGDVIVSNTRNALNCNNCKWPKSSQLVKVPYAISSVFSSSEKTMINDAISTFHTSTCVRFVPYEGIIQHELIHAVGFWHEQSRTDRDIYVKINYENILDNQKHNFEQRDTNNLNVPYDYSSVMHYGPKDWTKNGEDTITPLAPSVRIGQREGMSENDILKINKLYDCKDYLNKNGDWDNELTQVLNRQCPSGQAVSRITSARNNTQKDRLWGISCKTFKGTETTSPTCRWSGYVNKYQENMDFKCAINEVIAGAYSTYSIVMKDRRWNFYCCSASSLNTFNCKDTPVFNYWGEYFSWTVASSNFLTGVKSSFDLNTL
ncbi:hypothetical protein L3Q82_024463 [Scortum barcoo]|uniref:Uncharacterized protein n=1 Tax=Scortum barcoo TaxID=214431 RepID=A0ACB8WR94_9TELE|nr:hypothetical protein L3Q82_024463 [Scortum barcoo]